MLDNFTIATFRDSFHFIDSSNSLKVNVCFAMYVCYQPYFWLCIVYGQTTLTRNTSNYEGQILQHLITERS